LQNSGLLDLLIYNDQIRQFGRGRFENEESVKASGAKLINGTRDTAWLQQLSLTISILSSDPITMATLYQYFPDLINFFFEAIAITADYSNNGQGGGQEDELNDPQAILDDLVASFGQRPVMTAPNDINRVSIFEGAWNLINTAQRIEKALAETPLRSNTPPNTPDIFHLRLGASNFYIPPIKIDVNTSFKTSSLGTQALRQKTTAKFNAGYKEVSIGMRLYFPNYEEIWGISIDDVSKITVKDNYSIDFKPTGDSDEKIDKFLSSLRGLIAAFKYSPILPVKNHYLNSVHGITGVTLAGMSISTIPNYPFGLMVDIAFNNFNHKPLLPMISDFNQSIHWGKYRQYMGKAAGKLHNYVNEEFIKYTPDEALGRNSNDISGRTPIEQGGSNGFNRPTTSLVPANGTTLDLDPTTIGYKDDDVFVTNVYKEWTDGNNVVFYTPAETQTKIFTPDISDFRSDAEKYAAKVTPQNSGIWGSFLSGFGIDLASDYNRSLSDVVTTSKGAYQEFYIRDKILGSINILEAGRSSKVFTESAYATLVEGFIGSNLISLDADRKAFLRDMNDNRNAYTDTGDWRLGILSYKNKTLLEMKLIMKTKATRTDTYLDHLAEIETIRQARSQHLNVDDPKNNSTIESIRSTVKRKFGDAFASTMYNRFFQYGPLKDLMEAARERAGSFHIREWEVPMIKLDFDPKSVIVTGVSLSMSNTFVPLQLQMQDEPTYQHIGGGDTNISMSMVIFGEKELIKLRKMFDHINGLARLEHATGVLGFLGIKNIITALAGVKYVLPIRFDVQTVEGYPHVYNVTLDLVDFDIFQQKREQLSSAQQAKFVEEFGTKKNPFLRIKQLWGQFNAYSDFPLEIRNKAGEIVGTLDPDFYFRSFEMFDNDVVNNITINQGKLSRLNFKHVKPEEGTTDQAELARYASRIDTFKNFIRTNDVEGLRRYVKNTLSLDPSTTASYIRDALSGEDNQNFLIHYVDSLDESEFPVTSAADSNFRSTNGQLSVGNVGSNTEKEKASIEALLKGSSSLQGEDMVSFDPDELSAHAIIHTFPAIGNVVDPHIPALLHTSDGYQFGYINKDNGRFYLTVDGYNVTKDTKKVTYIGVTDTQSPDVGTNLPEGKNMTGIPGVQSLDKYQYSYTSGDMSKPEAMNRNGDSKSVNKHWEKMMIDTSYRDISGRMVRAFPTYMLWLVDEGNFAGTKLFDNFYGLQSIIDFSIVQSEDILGDTLVFRLSNMYAKLSTREASTVFNGNGQQNAPPGTDLFGLTSGLDSVIDLTLNRARNILGHMNSQYIVDIENIRLKPGVRVHLRGGYGSNPNSLHTLFNGIITSVELGEVVVVTAQSDAIELSPIVNSTNKKGSSGKIDGGINTGMYLSEPRDLMIRLLSMGTSKTREAFAHSTRGTIFSENKFGIKHFGMIPYQPLNDIELNKQRGIRNAIADTATSLGRGGMGVSGSIGAVAGMLNPDGQNQSVFGAEVRIPVVSMMQTLWSNFAAQRDMEIFKRNIYPGNGTGVAQYLGGDIGDGWASVSSLTPEDKPNPRLEYLNRLTDSSWNDLLQKYDTQDASAAAALDTLTGPGARESGGTAAMITGGVLAAAGTALAVGTGGLALPIIGVGAATLGLTGVLGGRGGRNIFRTLGLISPTDDDDMPGFDEISFRCQTYMKSVWDIFQTCARILPNYIVAVRPFEDRSTVFYGKPHWLYTSGVVPVTTGFPSEEKAVRLGLKTPSYINPDDELLDILSAVNSQSSSTADYLASQALQESTINLSSVLKTQNAGTDVYRPSKALRGEIIDFEDPNRVKYFNKEKEVISVLPINKGYATVGYHLPIESSGEKSENELSNFENIHKQIDQLPARFSFPYFTDRPAGAVLTDYAFFAVSSNRDELGEFYKNDKDYEKLGRDPSWNILLAAEAGLIGNIFTVDKGLDYDIDLKLDISSIFRNVDVVSAIGDSFIYGLDELQPGASKTVIRMPLPSIKGELKKSTDFNGNGSWEYNYFDSGLITATSPFSYRDWGSPKTAQDEQFYIAMRFPYKITEDTTDPLWTKFKEEYFSDKENSDFYGSVKDYKNRKVLIYSPTTNQAVVCKPAYFLWGELEADLYQPAESADTNRTDTSYINFKYSNTNVQLSSLVSPDAAYYLGVMSLTEDEKNYYDKGNDASDAAKVLAQAGVAPNPIPRECYYAFVDDNVPVGVVTTMTSPATHFTVNASSGSNYLIGFGKYGAVNSTSTVKYTAKAVTTNAAAGRMSQLPAGSSQAAIDRWTAAANAPLDTNYTQYVPDANIQLLSAEMLAALAAKGGNYIDYFKYVNEEKYDKVSRSELYKILDKELTTTGDDKGTGRFSFAPVYDPADPSSVKARELFDEDYSSSIHVLAGNGRTLAQANDIWDQFRFGYHNYDSVKQIFFQAYGINPEGTDPIPNNLLTIIRDIYNNKGREAQKIEIFKKFNDTIPGAADEFTALLGADFINQTGSTNKTNASQLNSDEIKKAIEYARSNFIDAPQSKDGLINYYNSVLRDKFIKIGYYLKGAANMIEASSNGNTPMIFDSNNNNVTGKQLFYLVVGIFRQAMWQEPYARAWLVLKPNRKYVGDDEWDFNPVNNIFAAFIDPNFNVSSDQKKFLKILADNKSEGNSAGNIGSVMVNGVEDFFKNSIGPVWTALSDGLSGLLNMFRVSMMQMGYGLEQVDNFARQANVLNKALNDSIYYSLGRPGSLLRAVDNPFTREYGEPVVEIREPFQRMHYLSSFSHILANNIVENMAGVATQVTAVSDGKYPVTVALDKSISSERQVEKTVETDLYFDNVMGSGIFGIAQPIFNPLEFTRGVAKLTQGAPDELTARRVALSHLKDSLKDIYGGELVVIGSPDIRPHDIVYLADVYERMYGLFEVEQVVHHFTADLGFITSITPNAMVSVNDPGRWFLSSWMHSWFSIKHIRDHTKILMNSVQAGSTGIMSSGNISVDGLSQALSTQLLGGIQFTHGSSALMKDVVSNYSAEALSDAQASIESQVKSGANGGVSLSSFALGFIGTVAAGAAVVGALAPLGVVGVGLGASLGAQGFWGGWQWVRDNVLDQHGCYIQYLNRNGQPMDAGLSINQGMVVGKYHSKKLLPGILGVRSQTMVDGNAYVRSDDILKSIGWKEKEINELVRYVSLENSLVNAEVLKYSGTGPDKAGFTEFFKVVCKINRFIDGGEVEVIDIFNPGAQPFKVKLDGIIAGNLNSMSGYLNNSSQSNYIDSTKTTIINTNSSGGRSAEYIAKQLTGKIFVIRIAPNDMSATSIFTEDDLDPGSSKNVKSNYLTADKYGSNEREKALGTIFYRIMDNELNNVEEDIRSFFYKNQGSGVDELKNNFKSTLFQGSVFYKKFNELFNQIKNSNITQPSIGSNTADGLYSLSDQKKQLYTIFYNIRTAELLYEKAAQWPYTSWDEYYEDGGPATLNWELVINGLAQVSTTDLLRERKSVISLEEQLAKPRYIPSR
jgi:hypothetical protein